MSWTERKGKVGGKSALGFLERLNVRASRHELVRWVRRSGQVARVSGEKYSWLEPRLGQIVVRATFFNDQPYSNHLNVSHKLGLNF